MRLADGPFHAAPALCAPPRTAAIKSWSRAKRTARRTSATPPQRTISPGLLSIILLKTRSSLVVVRAIGQDRRAAEILRKVVDRSIVDMRFRPRARCSDEGGH